VAAAERPRRLLLISPPAQARARQLPHGAPLILVYPFAPAMQRCAAVWSPHMKRVCVLARRARRARRRSVARARRRRRGCSHACCALHIICAASQSGTATVTPSRRHAPLGRKQATAYSACRPCAAPDALLRSAAPLLTLRGLGRCSADQRRVLAPRCQRRSRSRPACRASRGSEGPPPRPGDDDAARAAASESLELSAAAPHQQRQRGELLLSHHLPRTAPLHHLTSL
jgi:hypothetical protein